MLAPVVRAAAELYPDVQFTMLSQQRMADLFADMPANVFFHGVDLKHQSLRAITAGLGQYDAVADMHGVWRSRYIRTRLLFSGARVRTIRKGRLARWLLTHACPHRVLPPVTSRYCDVLRRLGLPVSMPSALCGHTGEGIGIAPFAAHKGKCYPLERMEQVVAMLSEKGEKIVLFGSKEEADVLESWAKKYKGVESVAGQKSLREELDIIRGLKTMVTMDSANMHLASLAGTRVVSVWGATHPKAGFLGFGQKENDCIQRDLKCRPCSIYGNKQCRFGDYRCMDIDPEEIVIKVIGDSY